MTRLRRITWLWDYVWVLALAAYMLAGTPDVPFHGDESTTIWMSRDYYYLFIARDLDAVRYAEPPVNASEQQLRLIAGTFNKYLFGFVWHAAGYTVDDLNQQWDWGADWDYNQQNGHAPTHDLLMVARWSSALFLAAGVALIFQIGKYTGGRPVAYLASLYYALNPALLLNGRRAMMEGTLIFFALLIVLAGIWLLHKRTWWAALLLEIASGLGIAAKHPNVFIVGAVFTACIGFALWKSVRTDEMDDEEPTLPGEAPRDPYFLLTALIVAGFLAAGIFYALNPAWWGDPAARAGQVLDERTAMLDLQVSLYGGYDNPFDQRKGFVREAFIVRPQYYEVPAWASYIGDQISDYEATLWDGISLGGSRIGALVMMALVALGGWSLWRERHAASGTRLIVGLWAVAALGSTAILTPLDWQRYYLIAYPVIGILAALGIGWVYRRSVIYLRKRRAAKTSGSQSSSGL